MLWLPRYKWNSWGAASGDYAGKPRILEEDNDQNWLIVISMIKVQMKNVMMIPTQDNEIGPGLDNPGFQWFSKFTL